MISSEITLWEGFLISLVGLGMVLVLLVVLIGVLAFLSVVVQKLTPKAKVHTVEATQASVTKTLAPGSCGALKLENVSDRDAAMIMAILANKLEKPLHELRFISIREIKENGE